MLYGYVFSKALQHKAEWSKSRNFATQNKVGHIHEHKVHFIQSVISCDIIVQSNLSFVSFVEISEKERLVRGAHLKDFILRTTSSKEKEERKEKNQRRTKILSSTWHGNLSLQFSQTLKKIISALFTTKGKRTFSRIL